MRAEEVTVERLGSKRLVVRVEGRYDARTALRTGAEVSVEWVGPRSRTVMFLGEPEDVLRLIGEQAARLRACLDAVRDLVAEVPVVAEFAPE